MHDTYFMAYVLHMFQNMFLIRKTCHEFINMFFFQMWDSYFAHILDDTHRSAKNNI